MNTSTAAAVKMGMVVLQTDETVELESRFYLRDTDARLLVSRIPVSDNINPASLQAMREHMQQSLALFPNDYDFDVVAYACTSAATIIGENEVAADMQRGCRARFCTNPLTAAKAALAQLGARRIAYLAPYISEVAAAMRENLAGAGFAIAAHSSFGIESDRAVAALPPPQILEAAAAHADGGIDAVFIACTNLHCAPIIAAAEQRLGTPVVSSNQALLWHMLTLAGSPLPADPAFGRLFAAS